MKNSLRGFIYQGSGFASSRHTVSTTTLLTGEGSRASPKTELLVKELKFSCYKMEALLGGSGGFCKWVSK